MLNCMNSTFIRIFRVFYLFAYAVVQICGLLFPAEKLAALKQESPCYSNLLKTFIAVLALLIPLLSNISNHRVLTLLILFLFYSIILLLYHVLKDPVINSDKAAA